MKKQKIEPGFIGGQGPLTKKEEEQAAKKTDVEKGIKATEKTIPQ